MIPQPYFSPLAMALCAAGATLSVYMAMVPQVSIGYLLRLDVLLAGLLPYFIYACSAWMRRGNLTLLVGAVLLLSDAWLRLPAADAELNDRSDVLFIWPLLATAGVILAYRLTPDRDSTHR